MFRPSSSKKGDDENRQVDYRDDLKINSQGEEGRAETQMVSIHEKDGSFSIPLAYSMYYIWGTRMLYGNYSYEFAIYPFSGSQDTTDIHKSALEYNFPVPVVVSEPGNGKLGNRVDLLSPVPDNIILSAMHPSAGNVYLRFYEYEGKTCDYSLSLFKDGKPFTEVDFLGNKLGQAGETIHFKPWEIKTLKVD